MDKILEGLVSSAHPLPLKRVIVQRVVELAETPLSRAQCRAMFALGTRLVLQGPDRFQRQVGRQVLEAYGRYHRAEFEAFFDRGLVLGLLQRGYGELSNRDPAILDYIQAGLRLIMSCPSVLELFELLQVEALRLVCERPAPPLCARLCQLLGDFPQCLPRGRKLSLAFCQQLVRSIAHFQSQGSREAELRLYVSQVTQVSGLLRSVWKAEPDTLLPSLQELFAVISATDTSFEPSVALASLVQHIPLQMITVLIMSLTTDPNVKDASMTQALCRMIDWLSWPLAQHVETWVIALLKGLAAVQKFTILIDVTLLKIELVFNRLWFPLVRPGALAVLSHMLLSFQHSPEAFHLVVPHVVSLVHSFKSDGLPSSTAFLMQLTELIHCMMYHYSGFPELYEPILEAIKDMPKPSEEKIKLILSQSAWTSQSSSLPSCLSRLSGKSETGKTGLINLGNTCYMNSVIQALFMATDFRRHVLSLNLNGCNSLMRKLQHLFAFLAHTQREAYAPRIFFEASRPPWFTPRSQQDCSEYLRFLLDRLHEEEKTLKALSSAKAPESRKNDESQTQETVHKAQVFAEAPCLGREERTLIEKMFGGKLKTTICCLNCKSTSQKEEAFTDLSLAFCPPASLENVGSKCVDCSEMKDDCGVETSTSATIPAGETPLNSVEINGGCDAVTNEGTTKDLSAEPNSETNSELNKGQENRDMSQRLVGKNTPSVTDLLNYFLAPEILSGDNKYYCEKCASLQNAEKTLPRPKMAASAAKKKNKKGKTLTLTDFLAEDGGGGGGPTYIPKPVSWADETDDLEGDVSTAWHSNEDDVYRAPPIDRSILPTAPRAAREPNIDRSRLPKCPPYTAFLGNLPYDVTEDSIKDFFRGLNISAVRLPREPTNPERLKGFGYAEFEDIDSLFQALSLNEESLGNRRIRVDVADQAQDKDRDDRCFGRDRDRFRDSERFESDWRARPATTDSFDDYPPRRGDDGFGDRYRDRYDDRYRDSSRRDMDRGFGGRDRYDDRSRDYDRGYDSRIGSGRRAFGSGYRRDDDYRGGSDRYDDRYDRRDDRMDRWSGRDDYGRDDFRRDDRGPTQRPKLNLKPRSAPKEEEAAVAPAPQSSRAASIFGGAKPVDTAAREREVEERLQKEQEKLQRQLEDDKRIDRRPRERHPSWRSEENQNQERSRTGSESSQSGPPGPTAGTGPTGRTTRRRESEKSLENEPLAREDEAPSPTARPQEEKQPLKAVPAPPPKENAWVKRSTNPPARPPGSDSEQHSPPSSQTAPGLPLEDGVAPRSAPRKGDESKADGARESGPKARSGSSGRGPGDAERKESRKDHDARPAPEPKKLDESPASFSHASKYAALSVDGEDDGEDEESAE